VGIGIDAVKRVPLKCDGLFLAAPIIGARGLLGQYATHYSPGNKDLIKRRI
jgi:hypothetical protein